jgi:protein ImuA
MATPRRELVLYDLRRRIRDLETGQRRRRAGVLPFGLPPLDEALPEGGLALGALHEAAAAEPGLAHEAVAMLFAAGIAARLEGAVLWALRSPDLFAPGLAGVGLHPDRVIYAEAGSEQAVLLVMEEGLRHGGLAAVIGEVSRLSLTASRRLQLAAEKSGALALALRRHPQPPDRIEPNAASSRWRIAALPSSPLPVPGLDRARWRVELVRCRGGNPASWELEACDAQGRLAVPAELADRPAAAQPGRWRAAAA